MSEQYDVMQVCENGHQITASYNNNPERRKKFCQDCGAPTYTNCPSCTKEIQGAQITVRKSLLDARIGRVTKVPQYPVDVPKFCENCGEPYPWTRKKIQTAIQILTEFGDLNEEEKKTIEQDVENIAKDVPEAELSARRVKRIWEKCSRAGYAVIMEFASRTAAQILKNP